MKFKSRVTSAFLAVGLMVSAQALAKSKGGDGVGNGGYIPENHFISIGYDWLDALTKADALGLLPMDVRPARLAELLRVTHVKFKHGVMLNGEPKSAVNYPKLNLITPDFDDWDAASMEARYQIVLHEFLPPMGVNDYLSRVSIPLLKLVRAKSLLNVQSPQPDAPQLLYSAEYDSERQGLDIGEAQRLCELHKELNLKRYYFVYCVYLEKIWFQDEKVVVNDVDGKMVTQALGMQKRNGQQPDVVLRWSHRPVERTITQQYSAYGIRVFGLGVEAELQYKVITSSLNLADGLASREFDSERQAYRACRARIVEGNDQSVRYYRATCRAPQNPESGRYYYEIVTKNPLVP